jgi:hypothetical protein
MVSYASTGVGDSVSYIECEESHVLVSMVYVIYDCDSCLAWSVAW